MVERENVVEKQPEEVDKIPSRAEWLLLLLPIGLPDMAGKKQTNIFYIIHNLFVKLNNARMLWYHTFITSTILIFVPFENCKTFFKSYWKQSWVLKKWLTRKTNGYYCTLVDLLTLKNNIYKMITFVFFMFCCIMMHFMGYQIGRKIWWNTRIIVTWWRSIWLILISVDTSYLVT